MDRDPGFREGRQYGRGKSGGQVRDEYRMDFDLGRGGFGRVIREAGAMDVGSAQNAFGGDRFYGGGREGPRRQNDRREGGREGGRENSDMPERDRPDGASHATSSFPPTISQSFPVMSSFLSFLSLPPFAYLPPYIPNLQFATILFAAAQHLSGVVSSRCC